MPQRGVESSSPAPGPWDGACPRLKAEASLLPAVWGDVAGPGTLISSLPLVICCGASWGPCVPRKDTLRS